MDFKKTLQNPKVQQGILEVIFPLVGFYFFGWSILIIVTFYYLDYISGQLMFFRRLYFIEKHQYDNTKYALPLSVLLFLVLFFVSLLLLPDLFFQRYLSDSGCWSCHLQVFFKEEWYLFPVILLMYYMMDKMFFYLPKRFMNFKPIPYLKKNLIYNAIATVLIVVGALLTVKFDFSDTVILFSIVGIKLGCDLLIKKRWLGIDI